MSKRKFNRAANDASDSSIKKSRHASPQHIGVRRKFKESFNSSYEQRVVGDDGTVSYYLYGSLHRARGPAIKRPDGTKEWWREGRLHREKGPAIEYADGTRVWFYNNRPHRENGPALVHANGSMEWWVDGQLHREGGPAIVRADGSREWWVNGQRHRADGPAVILPDGKGRELQQWFFNGRAVNLDAIDQEITRLTVLRDTLQAKMAKVAPAAPPPRHMRPPGPHRW